MPFSLNTFGHDITRIALKDFYGGNQIKKEA
jgi:hypothetical protein